MCIIHKGFSGFRILLHALNLVHLDRFEVRIPYASYTKRWGAFKKDIRIND